jgi:hypothetical protein
LENWSLGYVKINRGGDCMKKINIKSVLFILFFMIVGGFLGIFIYY